MANSFIDPDTPPSTIQHTQQAHFPEFPFLPLDPLTCGFEFDRKKRTNMKKKKN